MITGKVARSGYPLFRISNPDLYSMPPTIINRCNVEESRHNSTSCKMTHRRLFCYSNMNFVFTVNLQQWGLAA